MKNRWMALLVVLSVLMSGCSTGVSQEQYESVVAEKESLSAELNKSKGKYEELDKANEVLESQYQELLKKESTISTSFGGIAFSVPEGWKQNSEDATSRIYDTGKDCIIMISYIKTSTVYEGELAEEQEKVLLETVKSGLIKDAEMLSSEYVSIADNILALKTTYNENYGGVNGKCMAYIFFKSNRPYIFTQVALDEKGFDSNFIDVVNSVK